MDMDWKDKLSSLLDNVDLPAGVEPTETVEPAQPAKPLLHVEVDRKGRKGKTATIIYGFAPTDDIDMIASKLKQKLGVGGSARGGEILIQGERREAVMTILSELGYKVK